MSVVEFNLSASCLLSTLPVELPNMTQSFVGGRLYRHVNGSFEVIPKSPAEVFGERVLRPLIDKTCSLTSSVFQLVKRGVFAFDGMLSRSLQILPVANGESRSEEISNTLHAKRGREEKSDLEACVGAPLEQVIKITLAGVDASDHKMLEAAHKLYSPFFTQCFLDDTYKKMRVIHNDNTNKYEKENKLLEVAIEKCEQANPGKSCYKHTQISKMPLLEKVDAQGASEWKALQGYYCWSVWVDRWMWIDKFFASGGYNCDFRTNKPTV